MTCADPAFQSEQPRLAGAVDEAIRLGYHWAEKAAQASGRIGVPPSGVPEPYLVAGIVLAGMPYIHREWSNALAPHGVRVAMGGVFCHKIPIVKIPGFSIGCELGDLLVAHIHYSGSTVTSRAALLLQAKISPPKLTGTQLALYSGWPEFTYSSGPHAGEGRRITPPTRTPGAQCLELSPPPCYPPHNQTPSAKVGMADANPTSHATLGEEMARLPMDLGGRHFLDRPAALKQVPGDWDRVVWDLLDWAQSTMKSARFKWRGLPSHPRYGGAPMAYLDILSTLAAQAGPPRLHGASIVSVANLSSPFDEREGAQQEGGWWVPVRETDERRDGPPQVGPPDDTGGGASTIVVFTQGRRG